MKQFLKLILPFVMLIFTACSNNQRSEADIQQQTPVFAKGEIIDNPNFTGTAWLNDLIMPDSLNQNAVGSVTFEPGARTYWHSHPAGQIILALDGMGYYQEEGKPVEIIRKGDVVKCPHNVPHWHGASPDSEFVQVAITGRENGPTVWLNPVTDEEYSTHHPIITR